MAFLLDIPEEIGGTSAYLEAPGQYHAIVRMVHEESIPKDDGGFIPIPGGFGVELEVAHGDQADKKFSLTFWGPKMEKPDDDKGNVWARKKQAAFLLASDCISLSDLGKKGKAITLEDAVGSQILVEIEIEEYVGRDGKTYKRPQMVYANIYHIDDPRGKAIKRNEKLIATIAKEQRHPGEYFAPLMKKSESKPVPKSRMSADDLADL